MSELVNRAAVSVVGREVARLQMLLREQHVSDQGIDAHIEDATVVGHEPVGNGRLIAVQIKGGDSQFRKPTSHGWWFRFSARHADLWLNHVLPVIVILVDTGTDRAYWQEISPATVRQAGRGYKVEVPSSQLTSLAGDRWRELASGLGKRAPQHWDQSLERLPPAVGRVLRECSVEERHDAALLAFHLAEGRHNPAGIIGSLLATAPMWLERNGAWAWRALATYAASYQLARLAAEAFQRVAQADPKGCGRWLASAALHALNYDRALAAKLLERSAAEEGPAHVLAVLEAFLAHPEGDAGPIELPPHAVLGTEEAQRSAVVQSFLAVQAQRRGDLASALRYSEAVLSIDPTDSYAMCHRAELLMWSTVFQHADSASALLAAGLLREALDQRLVWAGPTREVTKDLARTCLATGDFHQMLEVCVEPPIGRAAAEIGNDSEIRRLGVIAAALLRRPHVVKPLLNRLGDEPADKLLRWQVGAIQLSDEERSRLYEQDFETSLARGDVENAASTCIDLAQLGVDVTGGLASYVDRSVVMFDTVQLAKALVAAYSDTEEGLPGLRELARRDKKAAELLVALLRRVGRVLDAVEVCDQVLLQGEDELFRLRRAELLVEAGDHTAEVVAEEVALRLTGFPTERARLLTYVAEKAADRGDWNRAERLLSGVVTIVTEPSNEDVWRLVAAQVNLARLDRAAVTIDRFRPEVRTLAEAELWLLGTASAVWDATRASQALSLASRFNHPKISTALLTRVVTTTRGSQPSPDEDDGTDSELDERSSMAMQVVPGDLHRQAFEALGQLVEKFGDETGIFVLRGKDEELVEQMIRMIKEGEARDRVLADLYQLVQKSQMPMGFVAGVGGKGYATLLVQRAFGPLVSAAPEDAEYEREYEAAVASLASAVVADASSLLTVSNAPELKLLGRFSAVYLASGSLRDIHRADSDVRASAASPGTVGLDGSTETLQVVELGMGEFVRRLNRIGLLLKVANDLPVRMVGEPRLLTKLGDKPEHRCWADSIEVAHQLGVALWSDDLGLRRIAESVGVPSFGSGALIDAVRAQALERASSDAMDDVLGRAVHAFRVLATDLLVDLPLSSGDARSLAETDGWKPGSGALVISRPSWWVWQAEPVGQLMEIYRDVAAHQPEFLSGWQYAAMLGAGRAVTEEQKPRILAALAVRGFGTQASEAEVVMGVENARRVAEVLGVADPLGEVPAALAQLANAGIACDVENLTERVLANFA